MDALPHTKQVRLLGRMDTMVARFLLNKQENTKCVLTSLRHCEQQVLTDASQIEGWTRPDELKKALAELPNEAPSGSAEAAMSNFSGAASSVTRMREYSGGQLLDALDAIREKGFDIGCPVSSDSSEFVVADAKGDIVVLVNQKTKDSSEVKVLEFLNTCKLVKRREEEVLHPGWPFDYLAQKEYLIHVMKMRIVQSLHVAASSVASGLDLVDLFEKPKRSVRAKQSIEKSSLVLVPNTMKVSTKFPGDPAWEGDICVSTQSAGEFACLEGVRFILSPCFFKDVPVLAWAVRPDGAEKQANMVWSKMKVSDVSVAEGPHERTKSVGAKASAKSKASSSSVSTSSRSSCEWWLEVPVLINRKALAKSEELVLHRPVAVAVKRGQPEPLKLSKIMKTK